MIWRRKGKEPEAPATVEAVETAPVVEPIIEKRKHIAEEIASHNAAVDVVEGRIADLGPEVAQRRPEETKEGPV